MAMLEPPPEEPEDMDWIFSYADLMTMLLGFFVILFSMSIISENKFNSIREMMSQTFSGKKQNYTDNFSPVETKSRRVRTVMALIEEMDFGTDLETILNKVEKNQIKKQEIDSAKAILAQKFGISEEKKKTGDGRYVGHSEDILTSFVLPNSTLFKSGTNTIKRSAQTKLAAFVRTFRNNQDIGQIEIVGHTSGSQARRSSKFRSEWSLSSARASSIAEFFLKSGVSASLLKASGAGSANPLFTEKTPQGRLIAKNVKKNERLQIVLRRKRIAARDPGIK